MEITLNWFINGYQNGVENPYALKTSGSFRSGLHDVIHGIAYTEEVKASDKKAFRDALSHASNEAEKVDIYCEALDQIWWRGLEAKPIWKRIPEFIHAWIYVRLHRNEHRHTIKLESEVTLSFKN